MGYVRGAKPRWATNLGVLSRCESGDDNQFIGSWYISSASVSKTDEADAISAEPAKGIW